MTTTTTATVTLALALTTVAPATAHAWKGIRTVDAMTDEVSFKARLLDEDRQVSLFVGCHKADQRVWFGVMGRQLHVPYGREDERASMRFGKAEPFDVSISVSDAREVVWLDFDDLDRLAERSTLRVRIPDYRAGHRDLTFRLPGKRKSLMRVLRCVPDRKPASAEAAPVPEVVRASVVVPGRTIIKGSLPKSEITRVIRRNLARFKYCYEKQLNANPNLAGKVSIFFTIAPTGTVPKASVRETSMNNKTVEDCTVRVMKSLRFPEPKGGEVVTVTYPLVFAEE